MSDSVPPGRLQIDYHTYYVMSGDCDITGDEVLGGMGTDVTHGMPNGLVVPGSGAAVKIRTGHQFGWIALDVRVLGSEPADDLGDWEAVEQAVISPDTEVQVFDYQYEWQEQFPDLTGGSRTEFLAIRVSARGRDANPGQRGYSPTDPPLEWHRIEAWHVTAPAPRTVLRRDETTRYWENASLLRPKTGD